MVTVGLALLSSTCVGGSGGAATAWLTRAAAAMRDPMPFMVYEVSLGRRKTVKLEEKEEVVEEQKEEMRVPG